jgi:ubiquinone/menaquinone biosynthesis C-methylase UbiE
MAARIADGAIPSPNIWRSAATYELENAAADRSGQIEAAMRRVRDWSGATLLDVGCGSGYHLPRWAEEAGRVIGVEPHSSLVAMAQRRTRSLAHVRVLQATAQRVPLPDAHVDVVHARWAYFFGPGCEPGLRELERLVRRGGAAFVIDNDATRSTFGAWFRRALPAYDSRAVERFWSSRGWQRETLDIGWEFERRIDLEAVVRIEFRPELAERILAEHDGLSVDYAVNLWWRTY